MRSSVLLALIALLVWHPRQATAQVAMPADASPVPETEVLGPGDILRITVWRKPEISGEYVISGSGAIADPFYMELEVSGLPLASAIGRIRAHVAQFEVNPRVLVEPLYRVSISGEVRQPDLYNLPPGTTIAQAVLSAGGLTDRARANRVTLVRGDRQQVVDLEDALAGDGTLAIRSADQIVVPRRASIVRDYVAPASSIIAASFSIISVLLRAR